MDLIVQYLRVGLRELLLHRIPILVTLGIVSFVIMLIGMTWKNQFETTITIYADNQNIIKPLLEGQVEVTVPRNERVRIVQEIMFSQRLLEKVIDSVSGIVVDDDPDSRESALTMIRRNVEISSPADNYISVAFSHSDPDVSYKLVNKITNLFIEESALNKRAESKSAYTFIDEQVKSYKNQLVEAENRLKAFESSNVEGTDGEVTAAINRLRASIDEIQIEIEADEIRVSALEAQLEEESRFAAADYTATVYRDRLSQQESLLETMLLQYRDNHPDVVSLRLQIEELKQTIIEVENQDATEGEGGGSLNPIYEQLSSQLSTASVELKAKRHRLTAYQNRLEEQYQRRSRVAENQAELSELTRDYDVNREIYEDLLERKERARISMTLDLAGQGVTYKVLEPAVYPTVPSGIRFVHFAIIGPVIGMVLPLGVLAAFLLFDTRIRIPRQVDDLYPGLLLAVVPPDRFDYSLLLKSGLISVVVALAYAASVLSFHLLT